MKKLLQISGFKHQRHVFIFLYILLAVILSGCRSKELPNYVTEDKVDKQTNHTASYLPSVLTTSPGKDTMNSDVFSFINKEGSTMETRINPPVGYKRIPSVKEELTGFLRTLKLKDDGSKVLLYNGHPKAYQGGHAAIFDLDVGSKNLQQCADSIIRIYAEYYWSIGDYDKIAFHLTNGFLMKYTKWRDGYRIRVSGNKVNWVKKTDYDNSYETFRDYLEMVFNYAGTLSLSSECKPISENKIIPGDMFLSGGSPGHCVLIVDAATDDAGNKCYLLAQGYMPAQDFHILKNPLHPEDPWYYTEEITYPLETPEWTFKKGSLVRWGDYKLAKARE